MQFYSNFVNVSVNTVHGSRFLEGGVYMPAMQLSQVLTVAACVVGSHPSRRPCILQKTVIDHKVCKTIYALKCMQDRPSYPGLPLCTKRLTSRVSEFELQEID